MGLKGQSELIIFYIYSTDCFSRGELNNKFQSYNANQWNIGQEDTKHADAERVNAEQVDAEQVNTKQVDTEKVDAKQVDAEQVNTEQEDTEQEDTEHDDGVTSAAGTASASTSGAMLTNLLLEHDNWPQWLVDGIVYLQKILMTKSWIALLASLVKFERSLGFTGVVSDADLIDLSEAD